MKNVLKLFILLTFVQNLYAVKSGKLGPREQKARNPKQKGGMWREYIKRNTVSADKHKPKDDDCGRCLTTCGRILKDCCAVTAALTLTTAPLAIYLWIKSVTQEKA